MFVAAAWFALQAALLALREGRDFTLRLQPVSTATTGSSSDGSGSSRRPPPLTLLFRPAESDQLLLDEPAVGIPAMPLRSSEDGSVASDGGQPNPDTASTELQPGTPKAAADRPAKQTAVYYFAIVQKQEAGGSRASALSERPPADPRSLSCSEIPLMQALTSMARRSHEHGSSAASAPSVYGDSQQLSWPAGLPRGGSGRMSSLGAAAAVSLSHSVCSWLGVCPVHSAAVLVLVAIVLGLCFCAPALHPASTAAPCVSPHLGAAARGKRLPSVSVLSAAPGCDARGGCASWLQ